jgi:hypothetical protein
MRNRPPITGETHPDPDSYVRPVAELVAVLVAIVVLMVVVQNGTPGPRPSPPRPVAKADPPPIPAPPVPAEKPREIPRPEPPPPPRIEPDRAAIAKAEEALDAASRDRARAEARAADAARRLADATAQAAADASSSRKLAFRVRDPSAQIARASARGAFLRAERDKLKSEVATLARMPRPKAKSLVDKNPVAKPASDEEFHFEIRRNRVTYIDLDRLINLVKADAQLRIRLSDNGRIVESKVGPVGAFALEYTLGRAAPNGIEDLMERHGLSYDLKSWELIPEFEGRGENYETASRPISEFSRAIARLRPERATITMWIYPDGFALFRRLRDDLHARGFTVAARPLPEGLPIRGSPSGSLSAGQ